MSVPTKNGSVEPSLAVRSAVRPVWALLGERALEFLIYLCGISAIIFVLGIFFFVFKEAFPVWELKVQPQPVPFQRPVVPHFGRE
jgi:hypothetical protein